MSQLSNYSYESATREGIECYYCCKSNTVKQKSGLHSCGKQGCPALVPNAARVLENEVLGLTSVVVSDLKKNLPGVTSIPYVEQHRAEGTFCWFCFDPDPCARFDPGDKAWCGGCDADSLLYDQNVRILARSRYLLKKFGNETLSSFVAPCPGCLRTKSGRNLNYNNRLGTILCDTCFDNGPQEP